MRTNSRLCWLAAGLVAALGVRPYLRAQEAWGPGESDLVISEIHFHPAQDESKEEFVELYNAGVRWVDLSGWKFTAGIEFTIPEGTVLPPAGFLAVARNAAALKVQHKIDNAVGDFKGNLSNTGETLELRDRADAIVLWIAYGDGGRGEGFWPEHPDGEGPSCELLEPHPDWHRSWLWRASRVPGGTPGRENSRADVWRGLAAGRSAAAADLSSLRINEVRLVESSPFVEVYNGGAGPVKLDGLKITRDPLGAGGVKLTGSVARKKLIVLDAAQVQPLCAGSGKRLYLLKADDPEIVDSFLLRKELPAEGSLGRFPDGGGDVVAHAKASPGAPNVKPPASDLVVNEILFHGRTGEKGEEEEFVEVFNRGKSPVALKGWKLDRAASFSFPDGATIPAGGYAVVASDPAKLKGRLSAEEQKLLFGPLKGKLSNSGDTVALINPAGDVADRVPYRDRAPWPSGADGGGFSLELLHPDLDNRWAQAWTLGPNGGSPGKKNVRAVTSMAPAIARVRAEPAAPTPDEEVTIHAHVIDTSGVSEVAVIYRDVNANSRPAKKTMSDSGQEDDGAAKDGHYAARLPKLRAGTLVGFYIQARDSSGKTTRLPEGDRECYFQVEAPPRAPSAEGLVYRVLMPHTTWERFQRTSPFQDTKFPCTFVASYEGPGSHGRAARAFHGASIRYRGQSSRRPTDGRMSYRVELARGDFFDGRDRVILNAYSPLRQKAGGDVMSLAGVPAPEVSVVRFKTPGLDDARYLDVEVVNNEFLDRRYGSSAGGIYRGRNSHGGNFNAAGGADLSYHGPQKEYYLGAYDPANKRATAEISGLIKTLQALSTKDESTYAQKVEAVIDADEWATYFAANHVLMNDENGLSKGAADDYFIARRPTDGKFILIAWDHDTTFSRMRYEPIFGPGVPAIRRFLQHPRFAPLYHAAIRRILDGPLAAASISRRLRVLEETFPEDEVSQIDGFTADRQVNVRDRYLLWPQALLISQGRPLAGAGFGTRVFVPSDAGAEAVLSGFADPAVAFKVKAWGEWASYDPITGRWDARRELSGLSDGPNPVWIELVGARDQVVALHAIDLERGFSPKLVPEEIEGKVEWKAGSGPYVLQGPTTLSHGSTLRIGPGVDVVCAAGSSLNVRGTLIVEGAATEPVTFRPADTARSWTGVRFAKSSGEGDGGHRLAHCRFEGGRAAAGVNTVAGADDESVLLREGVASGAFVQAQSSTVTLEQCLFRGIQGFAVGSEGGAMTLRGVRIVDGRSGIVARGGTIALEGCEVSRLTGDGIRLVQTEKEASVKGCAARDVLGTALSIESGKAQLDSVLVSGSRVAVSARGGARVRASRLTLVANSTGFSLDRQRPVRKGTRAAAPPGGGRSAVEVTTSVLGVEVEHVSGPSSEQVVFTSSLLAPLRGGDGLKGQGVLRGLPRFVSPQSGDFHLEAGTPGKGAAGGADWGYGP